MLLNKNEFKTQSFLRRLSITLRTLSPEKSFYFYLSLIALIVLSYFAICIYIRDNFTTVSPSYNQTIHIHSADKIKNYTPILARTRNETIITNMLFAGLLRADKNGSYAFDLAQDVAKSDDGLTIKVTIRPDANFSNGDPITSDDVIYTYKLIQDFNIDSPDRPKYEGMDFEKLDDKHLNIRLKKSYSQIDKALTLGIMSKNNYAGENTRDIPLSENNLNPISSGQYKLKSYSMEDNNIISLELENNNYYHTLSYSKYLKFDFASMLPTEVQKYFESNSIDLSLESSYAEDIDTETYDIITYNTSVISNIYLNPNKSESLSKKENREFLYKSIDRNYIVNTILGGNASTTYDILPASKPETNLDTKSFEDTTFAKASSTNLTLTYLSSDNNDRIYEYLKNVFIKYNINIIANPVDQDNLQNIIKNREFELLISSTDIEDVSTLYSFLHSSQKNAPGLNITSYVSKNFDKNTETLRYATSSLYINEALEDMKREFYIEYPYIPLYSRYNKLIKAKDYSLEIDNSHNSEQALLNNIASSYISTEHVYNFINKYRDIIIKVNKIIH